MDYKEALAYLDSIEYFGSKPGLERITAMLEKLGNPQQGMRFVHVAGTNGKGSCAAMTASVLKAAGYKTGLYTSPYLYRFNERMQINGKEIDDQVLADLVTRVKPVAEAMEDHPTVFEIMTATALLWYKEAACDIVVLEVGLGGRFDATNVIAAPECAVIMNIGLDHTAVLGGTVEQIAFEKAGIIRRRVPCIYSAKDPGSARVIREVCARMEAEPVPLEPDRYEIRGRQDGALLVRLAPCREEALDLRVPFAAQYQAENACLAALGALRLGARKGAVVSGIAHTIWPGRMEEISRDVFLDGAHNPDGIRGIAREIRRIAKTRRVSLVTAIVSDKDYRTMVRELCRDVAYKCVTVTEAGERRKMDPEELAAAFRAAGQKTVRIWPDAQEAYLKAKKERGESVLFCVGSLYLIGEIQHAELRRRTEEVSSEHGCE